MTYLLGQISTLFMFLLRAEGKGKGKENTPGICTASTAGSYCRHVMRANAYFARRGD